MNNRRRIEITSLLAAVLWALPLPLSAATLRVKSDSTNAAPDGLSWQTAFPLVSSALSAARAGDELWVAAGVYAGSLTLSNGIALYGGFAGTETQRAERDFRRNLSILDGQRVTNVLTVVAGASPTTRVDGFTIRNGRTGTLTVDASGAGMRVISADPVIANNRFLNNNCNRSGGALYLEASTASVISNYFGFNGIELTERDGGAIAVVRASPRIEGNSFVGNRGRDGGALHYSASTGFLIGNSMIDNTATRDGGAVLSTSASPQMTHNRFLGNRATARGGGIALTGGSATMLFNNMFTQNQAATSGTEAGGGGIFVDQTSQPTILNNTLVMNTAPVGGLLLANRNAIVANNIIAFGTSGVGGVASSIFQANNVFGNGTNYVGIEDPTGSGGNLSADPRFGGDLALGVINILPDSPCRDAGVTTQVPAGALDLDGEARIQNGAVDVGADETDGVATYFLPTVVRVAPNGSDQNDGGSWAQPMRTVQPAIDRAGFRGGEVWVAAGTYVGNHVLRPFTSIYAGFAGSETNRTERDWRQHETVLDGDHEGTVIRVADLDHLEAVDGFTIRNGAAVAGGGAFVNGNVCLENNRFEANEALPPVNASQNRGGGAIYISGGNPRIANNVFLRNRASSNLKPLTADGGALKVVAGAPLILNNLFRMNSASNAFSLSEARGGAILVLSNGLPQILNNTFLQNSVFSLNGSATNELGGALGFITTLTTPTPTPRLANNLIAYNDSGVWVSGRPPEIWNNLVWGNTSYPYSGITDPTGTEGNLSSPPFLTGPYGDPHLTIDSPALDAGRAVDGLANSVDLDGGARMVGPRPDIGVDEYDGTVHLVPDRVFYVRLDGSDAADGTSWATAKQTVEAGLAAAAVDGGEVWVQTGIYRERVRVELFAYLLGGFKGDETIRTARNWHQNPTVLHGGASQSNPVAGAPVVTVIGTDGYAAVDGFTIQNGAARSGAGLNVSGSPLIAHNLIRNNVAVHASTNTTALGGGLFCIAGAPRIFDNVFSANRATNTLSTNSRGGAIYLNAPAGQQPVVLFNTLIANRANEGGGVYLGPVSGARIANNIVAFGSSGLTAAGSANIAEFNCVHGNGTSDYSGLAAGAGSLAADPQLVDAAGGNFRLRADSPCINVGSPDPANSAGDPWDYFAEPRPVGPAPDLGADEFSGPSAADFELTLTQPLNGSVVVAPATVFLSSATSGGTATPLYIEYLAGTQLVATGTAPPFSTVAAGLIAGQYDFTARAVTSSGALATSAPVAVTVVLPPNNVPPTVSFSSPANNQSFVAPASVRTTFSWTKTGGGRVVRWELLTNGVLVASNPSVPTGTTSATFTLSQVPMGQYVLTAIVHDNVGSHGTNSVPFQVQRADATGSHAAPPRVLPDGSVQIIFDAPTAAADYVLESTSDFKLWVPISTNHGGANIQIVIPVPAQHQSEIFRTRAAYR